VNRPYRLTPIHEWHQQHRAHMVEVSGWMRVVDYGDPRAEVAALQSSVGLRDATPLTKIDVRGKHSARLLEGRWRIPEVGKCLSVVNARADGGPAYVARLTCERFIMLGSPEEGPQLYKRLTDAAAGSASCAHVTDVTSAYAVLQLIGPMSTRLLKKLSSVRVDSMTVGGCLEGPLAGVRVLLIRRDLGNVPSWLLLVSRDFGEYVWECVLSAGHEFGIRPFGTAAERAFASEKVTDVSVV
jgi:sarcosine oxidase, subunit alpha